jgi:hypothetical protein
MAVLCDDPAGFHAMFADAVCKTGAMPRIVPIRKSLSRNWLAPHRRQSFRYYRANYAAGKVMTAESSALAGSATNDLG